MLTVAISSVELVVPAPRVERSLWKGRQTPEPVQSTALALIEDVRSPMAEVPASAQCRCFRPPDNRRHPCNIANRQRQNDDRR